MGCEKKLFFRGYQSLTVGEELVERVEQLLETFKIFGDNPLLSPVDNLKGVEHFEWASKGLLINQVLVGLVLDDVAALADELRFDHSEPDGRDMHNRLPLRALLAPRQMLAKLLPEVELVALDALDACLMVQHPLILLKSGNVFFQVHLFVLHVADLLR